MPYETKHVTYDTALFEQAHTKFLDDATTLTDDDLEQLAFAGQEFADRARARRVGYIEPKADWETKVMPVGWFLEYLRDMLRPALGTYRHKLNALEKRVNELESRPGGGVAYGGIFDPEKTYEACTLVTRGGSLWLATTKYFSK